MKKVEVEIHAVFLVAKSWHSNGGCGGFVDPLLAGSLFQGKASSFFFAVKSYLGLEIKETFACCSLFDQRECSVTNGLLCPAASCTSTSSSVSQPSSPL